MMWYFEEKNLFGKWMPRTQNDDRPTAKSPAGTRREIRNVQEVPEELRDLPLGQLHQHFNTNPVLDTDTGDVRQVISEDIMALLRRLDDPERMTVGDGQEAAIVIRKLLAGTIFQEKRAYNAQRADHKPEARLAAGGKAY